MSHAISKSTGKFQQSVQLKNGKVLISASEIQLNTEVFHVTSMTP